MSRPYERHAEYVMDLGLIVWRQYLIVLQLAGLLEVRAQEKDVKI